MERILIVFFLITNIVFTKPAYLIKNLDITASINSDGSVNMQEKILYNTDDINGIFYSIDAARYKKIKNLEIFYQNSNTGKFKQAVKSSYLKEGHYSVAELNGIYKIKIYAPAKNQEKEFIFNYTLPDAVRVYNDVAVFKKKMISEIWNDSIEKVSISIYLPQEIEPSKLYTFAHTSLNRKIYIDKEKSISYSLINYQPVAFLETKLLFPPALVNNINPKKIINKNMLSTILSKEKSIYEKTNLKNKLLSHNQKIIEGIWYLGVLLWIFLVIYIYLKNSKKYKIKCEDESCFKELTRNYTPAVVGTLVDRKNYPESKELFATILDLVRKKYLILNSENNKLILTIKNKEINNLKDYEQFIFRWFIKDLGDGNRVVLDESNLLFSNKNSAKSFYSNFERWQTMVYTDMLYKNLKNDKKHLLSCRLGLLTGIIMFLGGMTLMDYFHCSLFIVWSILGFFLLPYSMSQKRYNLEKEEAYYKWIKVKNLLPSCNILELDIDKHFIYAIALGDINLFLNKYEKNLSNTSSIRELKSIIEATIKATSEKNSKNH